jgi:hypothetical protein
MNEAGHTQEPVRIGEVLPDAFGRLVSDASEDTERHRATTATDFKHEIQGHEGDMANLAEEIELNPGRPELKVALDAAKMEHLRAVADRAENLGQSNSRQ